jgi:twinkle protein
MKTAAEILFERGIKLGSGRPGNHKTLCPRCSHTRKKKRDPCLSVAIDHEGVRWRCHNNGCDFSDGEFYEPRSQQGTSGLARENIAIRFKLFTDNLQSNGRALAVPFVKDGKVINHKYRGPNKKFWMDKDAEKTFWNFDAIARPGLKDEPLLVVEGEMDGLAAAEAGYERVVSVPNGAESNLDFMADCWDALKSAAIVILCGDGDAPVRSRALFLDQVPGRHEGHKRRADAFRR